MKRLRLGVFSLLALTSAGGACADQLPGANDPSTKNALAIFRACFAPGEPSMASELKLLAYTLLAAKNGPHTQEVRDYVDGPFSQVVKSEPSPVRLGFLVAANSAANEFNQPDIDRLIQGCAANPRQPSLPPDLKDRITKLAVDAQTAQARAIMRRTNAELQKRKLHSAFDEDANAYFLLGLFNAACVPNMGQPEALRAWASERQLAPVTDTEALAAVVGSGPNGAAWSVKGPTAQGFALSLRGATEACAVWAEAIDPQLVEESFVKLIEGAARPGVELKRHSDLTQQTAFGKAKTIVYRMLSPGTQLGMEFTLIAGERPGGPFQASVQVARVSPR